jgi:uncharacterized protein YndB with AHSA1/START domain
MTVTAPPQQVWELVSDANHMPRWWPGVVRMEGVTSDRFTQVFTTKKGRSVRMDFHVLASVPPDPGGLTPGRRAWAQDVAATPFQRVLEESVIEVVLEPDGSGTKVTIAQRQKLRGYSRTGGFMLSRATRGKLTEALEGIERAVGLS